MKARVIVFFAAATVRLAAQPLVLPIEPYEVTGYSFAQETTRGRHLGEDVHPTLGVGTPVRAIADGQIFISKTDWTPGGYGQYVVITHSSPIPFVSLYAHLSRQPQYPLMGIGPVKQNDIVGYIGSSDENGGSAPHLHFAIYKRASDGRYHYWGYAPNASGDDVDIDASGNPVGGFFTKPSVFLASAPPPPPPGSILFSNLGPGDTFVSLNGWGFSSGIFGPGLGPGIGNATRIATKFISTRTASVSQIEVAASRTIDANFTAWLMTDNNGQPGTVLETFSLFLSPSAPSSSIVLGSSAVHPVLSAGSAYWLALGPANFTSSIGAWWPNSIGANTTIAWQAYDQFGNFGGWIFYPTTQPAFRITGQ